MERMAYLTHEQRRIQFIGVNDSIAVCLGGGDLFAPHPLPSQGQALALSLGERELLNDL